MSALNRVPCAKVNRKYQIAVADLNEAKKTIKYLEDELSQQAWQDSEDRRAANHWRSQSYSLERTVDVLKTKKLDLELEVKLLTRQLEDEEKSTLKYAIKAFLFGASLGAIITLIWSNHAILF